MSLTGIPYWRLSILYFVYFALVGVISPYWPVYLNAIGFSGNQIGLIIALPMLTRIAAPSVWGWLADRSGRYLQVVRIGSLAAFIAFTGLFFVSGFWGVVLFTCVFTFFWNAILPQIEVITLDCLKDNSHFYSYIRLWGSIGFIVAVVALGVAFEVMSAHSMLWIIWGLLAGILLSTLPLPQTEHVAKKTQSGESFLASLFTPQTASFFIASIFLHVSHGGFYGFYSLYLLQYDYSSTFVGVLWAIGVVAEIIIFIKVPAIFRRFSLKACLVFSIVIAALRWWIVAQFPQSAWLIIFAQALHAFTFGLAHAVAMEYLRTSFPAQVKGRAQALYSALCFGAGGAIGAYVSGILWSFDPAWCFYAASISAGLGAVIGFYGLSGRPKAK